MVSLYHKRFVVFYFLCTKWGSLHLAGGFAFSGIALILLAAHKCAFYWPASHASITQTRSSGTKTKPSSGRKGDRDSGGRSPRDFGFMLASLSRNLPQSPTAPAPSRREPLAQEHSPSTFRLLFITGNSLF